MLNLRPEVAAFAQAMEAELQKHDDRSGWKREDEAALYFHLLEEVIELGLAIRVPLHVITSEFFARERLVAGRGGVDMRLAAVLSEAADIGNLAMMVADASDALPTLLLVP